MEHKNYLEFKRLTLIEPPCLYYTLSFMALLIGIVLATLIILYLRSIGMMDSGLTVTELLFINITICAILLYRQSRERALIHEKGTLEVYGFNYHTTTSITEIKQVHFKKRFTICGYVIVIKLELKNGKVIKLLLKENEQFLSELKKHNPNLIIPELPIG